jgi:hypothetical protein
MVSTQNRTTRIESSSDEFHVSARQELLPSQNGSLINNFQTQYQPQQNNEHSTNNGSGIQQNHSSEATRNDGLKHSVKHAALGQKNRMRRRNNINYQHRFIKTHHWFFENPLNIFGQVVKSALVLKAVYTMLTIAFIQVATADDDRNQV